MHADGLSRSFRGYNGIDFMSISMGTGYGMHIMIMDDVEHIEIARKDVTNVKYLKWWISI